MTPILDAEYDPSQRLANGFLYHRLAREAIDRFGYPPKFFNHEALYIDHDEELKKLSKEIICIKIEVQYQLLLNFN